MTDLYLWGKHPIHTKGEWIILDAPDLQDIKTRPDYGFETMELPKGVHPDKPYGDDVPIRIYVACLAAYNNGELHGHWIDATLGEDHISEEIAAMLAASPMPDAEEWAIHDFEGFEGASIAEYESIQTVAELAAFIEEYGPVAAMLAGHYADLADAKEAMRDHYAGVYPSVEDFVQELTEEITQIPDNLQYYIEWESMARDMEIDDILVFRTGSDEVHIFWQR
jgi:antirestriction protein